MAPRNVDVSNNVQSFIENISAEEWAVYSLVLKKLQTHDFSFALGGAIAYAGYTGRLRNTKDLDIYVSPRNRDAAVQCLTACGLNDYYDELPYDRNWIYRGKRDGAIMDVIFKMANNRTNVTRDWIERGPVTIVRGVRFRIIPAEELMWSKLYVMQRERCDWPDVLNVVHAMGPALDWDRLLALVEDDLPLVRSLLSVYCWMTPEGARSLPGWLWDRLELPPPDNGDHKERVHLLDTRPWFGKAA